MSETKNIIVTGGAGYIGSHACKALARAGYQPITIDNFSTGWRDAIKFGPFEEVDLLDRTCLDKVFSQYKPCAVMHFAALSQVGESVRQPSRYWRNNVMGSLNLIEAAIAGKCFHLVFSSTCATYGDHDGVMLTENTHQCPTTPYGKSKLAVENMLWDFGASHGLRHVTFRYFNVSGADPDGEIGENHEPETHLVPLAIRASLGKASNLTVYGSDYPTHDGTCIRDYVHVSDLVDAHILGLEWLQAGHPPRDFNLGSGIGYSVQDVLDNVASITGQKVPIEVGERRVGDCASLVSNPARAMSELGWEPKHTNLKDMIMHTCAWEQREDYLVHQQ